MRYYRFPLRPIEVSDGVIWYHEDSVDNKVILYHGDEDGLVCSMLLSEILGDCAKVEMSYSESLSPEVYRGKEVWLCDYSFAEVNEDLFRSILELSSRFMWIDHHLCSKLFIENNEAFVVALNSGKFKYRVEADKGSCAEICYEMIGRNLKDNPSEFIELLSKADRWNPSDDLEGYFLLEAISCSGEEVAWIYQVLRLGGSNLEDEEINSILRFNLNKGKGSLANKLVRAEISLPKPKLYDIKGYKFHITDVAHYPLYALKKFSDNVGYLFSPDSLVIVSKDLDLHSIFAEDGAGGHSHVVGIHSDRLASLMTLEVE